MTHPYYGKELRKKSSMVWIILFVILVIAVIIPWVLPASMTSKGPFAVLKAVTTIPMEYEWEHSFSHEPSEVIIKPAIDPDDTQAIIAVTNSYFPLEIGNQWTYEHISKGHMLNPDQEIKTIKTMEIIEKRDFKGQDVYTVKITEDDKESFSYYFLDELGLQISFNEKYPLRRPILVLQANPQIDDSWFEYGKTGAECKVISYEEKTTPAGTFDCMLIETRYSKSDDKIYQTWYSKNVGIVCQQHGTLSGRGIDKWELQNVVIK